MIAAQEKEKKPPYGDYGGEHTLKQKVEEIKQKKSLLEKEKLLAQINQAKLLSNWRKEISLISNPNAKKEVSAFAKDLLGLEPESLGAAADRFLESQKLHGFGIPTIGGEPTIEDYAVRGESPPSGGGAKALAGGQLLLTAIFPAEMVAFLGLGAISNLNHQFRGYAIADTILPPGGDKSPDEMTDLEKKMLLRSGDQRFSQGPARYFFTSSPIDATRLYARSPLMGAYKNEDRPKLPGFKKGTLQYGTFADLPSGSSIVRVGSTNVFKVYSPKSINTVISESGETIATIGLVGETPGEALGKITGTENTALPMIADIVAGIKITKIAKSLRATKTIDQLIAESLLAEKSTIDDLGRAVSDSVPPGETAATTHLEQKAAKIMEALEKTPSVGPTGLITDIGPIGKFFGSLGYQFKKLPEKFLRTANNLLFGEVYRNYELASRTKYIKENVWDKLTKEHKKNFSDIFDGKNTEEVVSFIRSDGKRLGLADDVIESEVGAIRKLKEFFEADRIEIIAKRRARGIETPDNWGLQDTYFPHVFRGQIRIERVGGSIAGFANTMDDARTLIASDSAASKANPNSYKTIYDPQNAQYWLSLPEQHRRRVVEVLSENSGMAKEDIVRAMDDLGLTDKRSPFFMKERHGAPNYEKDALTALEVYNRAYSNFKYLSPIAEDIEKTINELLSKRLNNAAAMLKSRWDAARGIPTPTSQWFDQKMFEKFGGHIKPRALDRWLGYWKQFQGWATLANPRFAGLINPSQPLETVYAYGPASKFREAYSWIFSPEGKQTLNHYGHIQPGSKFVTLSDVPLKTVPNKINQAIFASEDLNLKTSWAYFYRKGLELGLSPDEANRMGVIRGMVGTQYLSLMADRPQVISGPISSTVYQFNRFFLKNAEQFLDIIRSNEYPAAAKFIASKLVLGGARTYIPFEVYQQLQKKDPEFADVVYFGGLGQLVGSDLSGSYSMINWGPGTAWEKIGRQVGGIVGGNAIDIISAMVKDGGGPKPTTAIERGLSKAATKAPLFKMIVELGDLWDENKEVTDADSRTLFLQNATSVYKGLLGLTDKNISIARDLATKNLKIKDEMIRTRKVSYQWMMQSYLTDDPKLSSQMADKAESIIDAWNEMQEGPFIINKDRPYIKGLVKFVADNDPTMTNIRRMLDRHRQQDRPYLLEEIEQLKLSEQLK